jgi:hypothetical protein
MKEIIEIESEAISLAEQGKSIVVTDQISYNQAVDFRVGLKDFIKKVDNVFDPLKKKAHESWQAICKQQNTIKKPAESALSAIDDSLRTFTVEQERLRREEEDRLRREAEEKSRREAEDERLRLAETAKQNGASDENVDEILDAPIIVNTPVAIAAPTYEKSAAVVMRDNYSAEVTNLHELVKAVAKDKSKLNLLQANQTALNAMARALKDTMSIPGVRAVNKQVLASGRGY